MGEEVEFTFDNDNTIQFDPNPSFDDEIELHPQKQASRPAKNIQRTPQSRSVPLRAQMPRHVAQPNSSQDAAQSPFRDTTFEAFSNPAKRAPEEPIVEMSEEGSVLSNNESHEEVESIVGYGEDEPPMENQTSPAAGFATIEDEKQDLLYRFHRLESKGVKVAKKFNMYSDVREMRNELSKLKRDSEVNSSVKFSKQILMTIVSATELLNKRYDPFSVELNGWSETVMENVNDGDYDNVFERLHDKYAGKMNTPPEMELMLSLAGSAVMFHMTSTMFKSVPNISDMARQNPDVQNAMKSMAESLMRSQTQPSQTPEVPVHNAQGGRREMKGPSIDLSQFGNMMPPPAQSAPVQREAIYEVPESVVSDSGSEASGMSVKRVSVAMSEGGTRRGRKPKINATRENTIDI